MGVRSDGNILLVSELSISSSCLRVGPCSAVAYFESKKVPCFWTFCVNLIEGIGNGLPGDPSLLFSMTIGVALIFTSFIDAILMAAAASLVLMARTSADSFFTVTPYANKFTVGCAVVLVGAVLLRATTGLSSLLSVRAEFSEF